MCTICRSLCWLSCVEQQLQSCNPLCNQHVTYKLHEDGVAVAKFNTPKNLNALKLLQAFHEIVLSYSTRALSCPLSQIWEVFLILEHATQVCLSSFA